MSANQRTGSDTTIYSHFAPHTYQLKIEEKDAVEAKAKLHELEVEARAASEKVAAEKASADTAAADAKVATFSSVRI